MAGKIIADQIEHSTAGSLDTSYVVNGSAKAIWDLDGTGTIALQDSFNVSGALDLGTGLYQISYTNSFATANNMPLSHTLNFTGFDITITNIKTASYTQFYLIRSTDGNIQDSKPFGATYGDLA